MNDFCFLCCDPGPEGSICVVDSFYNVLPFSCSSFSVREFRDGSLRFTFDFKPEALDNGIS